MADNPAAGSSLVSVVSLFRFSVELWLVWALVMSLSLMHAGDFQCRLLLFTFLC